MAILFELYPKFRIKREHRNGRHHNTATPQQKIINGVLQIRGRRGLCEIPVVLLYNKSYGLFQENIMASLPTELRKWYGLQNREEKDWIPN